SKRWRRVVPLRLVGVNLGHELRVLDSAERARTEYLSHRRRSPQISERRKRAVSTVDVVIVEVNVPAQPVIQRKVGPETPAVLRPVPRAAEYKRVIAALPTQAVVGAEHRILIRDRTPRIDVPVEALAVIPLGLEEVWQKPGEAESLRVINRVVIEESAVELVD